MIFNLKLLHLKGCFGKFNTVYIKFADQRKIENEYLDYCTIFFKNCILSDKVYSTFR